MKKADIQSIEYLPYFMSIFIDDICSLLHPNFSPYLIQYFVEAFTKDCLDNGSVNR